MREIKYRAWKHVNTPEMFNEVQGINFVGGFVYLGYRLSSDTVRTDKELLDNLILMQYTGLKDKNGTEIYEGDIVKVTERHVTIGDVGTVGQVEWGLSSKRFGTYPAFAIWELESEMNSFSEIFDGGYSDIEVIGNIYENPELLEVE